MSLEADAILDRRKLRRKLTFWRVAAFGVGVAALLGAAALIGGRGALTMGAGMPHVARIEVKGLITGNEQQLRMIRDIGRNGAVRGVIVEIDSPGGTVAGSEALYEALREVAATKPVVATIDTVAASGGYIAALATDRIIARSTSTTGSIGVVAQYPNVSQLLKTIGVEVETMRSAPLKMMPSGLEPTPEAAKAAVQALVDDNFAWFKGLVKERRKLSDDEVKAVSDGRVFTGRGALMLKLIDGIGDQRAAREWLAGRDVPTALPVREWKPKPKEGDGLLRWLIGAGSEALGLGAPSGSLYLADRLATQTLLEGPLALWQPPGR